MSFIDDFLQGTLGIKPVNADKTVPLIEWDQNVKAQSASAFVFNPLQNASSQNTIPNNSVGHVISNPFVLSVLNTGSGSHVDGHSQPFLGANPKRTELSIQNFSDREIYIHPLPFFVEASGTGSQYATISPQTTIKFKNWTQPVYIGAPMATSGIPYKFRPTDTLVVVESLED